MIVYEQNNQWVMITQHDHAAVSGQVAKVWRKDVFEGMHVRDDVLYAIAQHDRGWIGLDQTPFWNDGEKKPYSFQDFPAVPKLRFTARVWMKWKLTAHTQDCCAAFIMSLFSRIPIVRM